MKNKTYLYCFVLLFSLFSYQCLGFSLAGNDVTKIPNVKYKTVELTSLKDIEKFKDSHELYSFSKIKIDLNSLPLEQKKEVFVNILLPAIEVVNAEITRTKQKVAELAKKPFLSEDEYVYAKNLFTKYKVSYGNWNELQDKLIIYPTSLILTQGAIESGWGTSRFFKEGNNLFGMLSVNPNEARIQANFKREDGLAPHFKKYNSIKDSVADIVLTLSRNNVYKNLRKLVNENKSPIEIANGLRKYSEQGELYVKKVINTLNQNNFQQYDM